MAITNLALLSERWLDEIVMFGSIVNTAGTDINEQFRAPAGLGDLAIMEAIATGLSLATPVAADTNPAAFVDILSSDAATVLDIVGVFRWFPVASTSVSAYLSPDPLVLWREGELIRIVSPELDTNATPTGDMNLVVKAVRVRPQAGAVAPMKLVR